MIPNSPPVDAHHVDGYLFLHLRLLFDIVFPFLCGTIFRGTCRQAGLSDKIHGMYYLYILQSSKNSYFYTGLTKNIQRRLQEHNSGRVSSTRTHTPFNVVYEENLGLKS